MMSFAYHSRGLRRLLAIVLVAAGAMLDSGGAYADKQPEKPSDPVARFGFPTEHIGFVVQDAKTGEVLAAHGPNRLFIPASVSKIPTALAALEVLGAAHRFTTTLHATGELRGGVWHGDLYIRGGGNPFFDSENVDEFVTALREAGILGVEGRFLYDVSYLPAYTKINPLQPDAAVYNTGVAALSLNFNRVQMQWQRQDGGSFAAQVRAVSSGRAVPLESFNFIEAPEVLRSGAMFAHAGDGEANDDEEGWVFAPTLPEKGHAWLPVRDAGLIAARVLRGRAAGAGIELPEPEQGVTSLEARLLHRHASPPLAEILRKLLRYSNNLTAELVGLVTARELLGEAAEIYAANKAVAEHLAEKIPGDWAGFAPGNFSGLNSYGRVSPAHIAAMLRHAHERKYGETSLYDLLPATAIQESVTVVRKKGNKKRKVTQAKTVGTARAKTGTMAYARGLAGYIDAASGRRLVFAYFANDPAERQALDTSPAVRSPVPPAESRRWLARAKSLERHLLLRWAKAF